MSALRLLAEGFHNLAQNVRSNGSPPMTIKALADACSPLVGMIELTGPATDSWMQEIVAKVGSLKNASNHMTTLEELIEQDKANNCVGSPDSNSLVLVRLRRSIEALKVLAEELLKGRDVTLQTAAETAYLKVFAPYHDSITRYTATEAISVFPSRELALIVINETADEADMLLSKYVNASALVVDYIDRIFKSKGLGTNW